MCLEDAGEDLICCICAPLAAILCCKFCKDRKDRTDVHQAPSSPFHQQPTGHVPIEDIYGRRSYHQTQLYPDHNSQSLYTSHNYPMKGNHLLPQQAHISNDLPSVHLKRQAILY